MLSLAVCVFYRICAKKAQISCSVTAQLQLINVFSFATWIVHSLYLLYSKFQALAIFCGYIVQFVTDMVRNPKDRTSPDAAHLSHVMRKPAFWKRKPAFWICEIKDADQLRSNCAADQSLCFQSLFFLNPSFQASSRMAAQFGLYQTLSETQKTDFLMSRLICCRLLIVWHLHIHFRVFHFCSHLDRKSYSKQ